MKVTNRQLILLAEAVQHMAHGSQKNIDALIEFFEGASQEINFDNDQGEGLHYTADEMTSSLLTSLEQNKQFLIDEEEERRIKEEADYAFEEEGEEDDA